MDRPTKAVPDLFEWQSLHRSALPETRKRITAAYLLPEPEAVQGLLPQARAEAGQAASIAALASRLVLHLRESPQGIGRGSFVQGLLQQYALSSQEGVALMCLAEALLRIPDAATRDDLIRDKLTHGDWQSHLGHSDQLFVNAATWGLVIGGGLLRPWSTDGLATSLTRLLAKGSEPLIRRAVDAAMRLLGQQFVMGRSIGEALQRAKEREARGFRHSYDMLGEAAMTDDDALAYLRSYEHALDAIGLASAGRGLMRGPGLSIKLSALHPRFVRAQERRVASELYPRLLGLAVQARRLEVGLNLDAEETDRLDLSVGLLERLCEEPALAGWDGIGFVVQAYQKRCAAVIDHLVAVARRTRRRLMVRLVKGAYWDSEIKRAQVDGLPDYPVFTRKAHTDVSYLACARRLLAAPDAIYPQFATHNAQTVASIHEFAGADAPSDRYEFQCLHGMGEPLYEAVVKPRGEGGLGRSCRIYAPVGTHETLLAYLVRRLLENGANTSFVNRVADESVMLDELVIDPVKQVEAAAGRDGAVGLPHPAIVRPPELFGAVRRNSVGLDLRDEATLARLHASLSPLGRAAWQARPVVHGDLDHDSFALATSRPIFNPADRRDVVGDVVEASPALVAAALEAAVAERASNGWWEVEPRVTALLKAADALERGRDEFIAVMVREAGKTIANAAGEVREAVDFLRYGAAALQAASGQAATRGAGRIVVCISPWNFPLSIFVGQIVTGLAAGHAVLAKPAEQTPLVAALAVRLLHEAGVPKAALQLLPGAGETVGAALVKDERVSGVLFTGSHAVARQLQRSLAGRIDAEGRPATLVAETGGLNAMIVDSSALTEQVVADVLTSAFDSAGQRCSALRVLCVQEEAGDRLLTMLEGAMRELVVGRPDALSTDIGPVIDEEARDALERHVEAMRAAGRRVVRVPLPPQADRGSFVAPTLIHIERLDELKAEVFGPILHVLRYRRQDLHALVDQINATGYGLTFGLQTRVDRTVELVTARIHAGNQYVNRNMIGAVVGVQPFGGEGLSGTGPKAGGPLSWRPWAACLRPPGLTAPEDAAPPTSREEDTVQALRDLRRWAMGGPYADLASWMDELASLSPVGHEYVLAGPTGERNVLRLVPRSSILCLASSQRGRVIQLATVLAAGSRAAWLEAADDPKTVALRLPRCVRDRIVPLASVEQGDFTAALAHGDAQFIAGASRLLAGREGPIVTLQGALPHLPPHACYDVLRLMIERSISINTAAAGGNASLMTLPRD